MPPDSLVDQFATTIEEALDANAQQLFSMAAQESKAPGYAKPLAIAAVVAVVLLGVIWLVSQPTTNSNSTPAPTQKPKEPAPKPTATKPQAPVKFRIKSDPEGAHVRVGGKDYGPTPLEFTLPAGSDGMATAELVFSKDGYQTLTFTAAGSGDVVVSQTLRRSPKK